MKTSDLTVRIDPDFNCWVAFHSSTGLPWDSSVIGEGSTRENAIADYWHGIHGKNAASLLEPYDNGSNRWALHDGTYVVRFDTRAEAVAYAEAHQYIVNPFAKEV